ncbi:MAG: hypothetical protein UV61_C0003G0019 [Candidatus Gottesmanbacteria bacterium GW2011_GWB1_43_11]|uniref:Methyltransferase type 11 domain-containing protein n=1 Tax=Candidatus Gottesmanbacteria bacterium GW2011_GWB1_43_11 TaxID=1618446 RepID=A0A0G1EVX2_9BACT|nr:MAG: hypothetical protein UV04_C0002G0020 [Candidatus Gottesmanbacteria bacterium GW2011_GWA2_42_16]KKS56122.1 MAG: hypothetical protein UV17_C0002G0019 [Candidatus Gottesmanbacteria bacterium GW2011_GWA1_42_26]KKS82443.1 MAG: hypothetical protein UV55_C0002G0021 [Candidatus Gottesmanbacteria bacterium GW2011_GWC1_43_10]KKS87166.1 MAG: hypothetical protein UV61_C0003G0019 [Candidatus Gottesmanbacteria bacterium GW2011_GWB1_43_11]
MRYGSYIKNYKLTLQVEDRLIQKMLPSWRKMQILDVGCGPGEREKDRRFQGADILCFDIYTPYLEVCKRLGFQTKKGDARFLSRYFRPKSFDIVLALDVIEHMTRSEGRRFLKQLEIIARKQIIILTPLGWFPQDHECVGDGTNKHQQHKSAWYRKDFELLGYECEVLYHNLRDIRNGAKALIHKKTPIPASQMWVVKLIV